MQLHRQTVIKMFKGLSHNITHKIPQNFLCNSLAYFRLVYKRHFSKAWKSLDKKGKIIFQEHCVCVYIYTHTRIWKISYTALCKAGICNRSVRLKTRRPVGRIYTSWRAGNMAVILFWCDHSIIISLSHQTGLSNCSSRYGIFQSRPGPIRWTNLLHIASREIKSITFIVNVDINGTFL
jgi:hypothetical protein